MIIAILKTKKNTKNRSKTIKNTSTIVVDRPIVLKKAILFAV